MIIVMSMSSVLVHKLERQECENAWNVLNGSLPRNRCGIRHTTRSLQLQSSELNKLARFGAASLIVHCQKRGTATTLS